MLRMLESIRSKRIEYMFSNKPRFDILENQKERNMFWSQSSLRAPLNGQAATERHWKFAREWSWTRDHSGLVLLFRLGETLWNFE